MVEWIARWFSERGLQPAVISRGYGSQGGRLNDEALELAWNLPGVPHLQNPDRVAAAQQAVGDFRCRVIVLDDAFQHRRIGRDLDIVLLDAMEPWGFGHVFPRGTLREPLVGLGRANVIALSRADTLSPPERRAIRERVASYAPQADWLAVAHAPRGLVAAAGGEEPLEWLAGKRVLAFCGIGNPAGFRHTLAACRCEVAEFREFADHHPYDRRDCDALAAAAERLDVAAVVCTHKDLVKLAVDRLGDRPLRAIRIGLEILEGQEVLEKRLSALATCQG
jgi:tetraacyldisaccharide 4'-kinase